MGFLRFASTLRGLAACTSFAALSVVLVAATGCAAEPAITLAASAVRTPAPASPRPLPEPPPAAPTSGAAGARAYARHWYEQVNYGRRTGDWRTWEATTRNPQALDLRDRKERFTGHGDLTILAVQTMPTANDAPTDSPPPQQQVKVELRLDPILPWEETEQYTDLLTLTWNGNRWFPSGLQVIDVERLPVARPVTPEAATEQTVAGAQAWLDHYYAVANYGHLTWDWAPLLALHAGYECDLCQAIPDGYRFAGPGDIKRSPIAGSRPWMSADGRQVSITTGVDRVQAGGTRAYERYIDQVTLTWRPRPRAGWQLEHLSFEPYEEQAPIGAVALCELRCRLEGQADER